MKRKSSTLLIFNLFVLKPIPGGSNFKQNLREVVYVSAMHLFFKKLSTESGGFSDVVFKSKKAYHLLVGTLFRK